MPYFIFVGDMLVMLFMVILVVWVFVKSSDKTLADSAMIPLLDEEFDEELDMATGQTRDQIRDQAREETSTEHKGGSNHG